MAKTVLASAAFLLLGLGIVLMLVENEHDAARDIAASDANQVPLHALKARGRVHCAPDLRCTFSQGQDVATLR